MVLQKVRHVIFWRDAFGLLDRNVVNCGGMYEPWTVGAFWMTGRNTPNTSAHTNEKKTRNTSGRTYWYQTYVEHYVAQFPIIRVL
jgi:hypothetical protein